MRRNLWLAMVLACAFLLAGCGSGNGMSAYEKMWGVDLSGGTMLSETDSHGFHGDGALLRVLQFEDDTVSEALSESTQWQDLPLSENLNTFIYQPYDSEVTIPAITYGYYSFYDRHAESQDPQDDTQLLRRASFNFTLAIYDADTQRLYLLEYDT